MRAAWTGVQSGRPRGGLTQFCRAAGRLRAIRAATRTIMARHPSSNASAGVRLSTVGRAMRQSGKTVGAAFAALAVAASACVATSDHGSVPGQRPCGNDAVITVGSFDFAESVLLANIYGQALAAKGFPVRIFPNLGTRELVDPALMSGLIQLVPEYAGSALQFATLG